GVSRDDHGRQLFVRTGLLPRKLCVLTGNDDRRRAVRPRDAGSFRRNRVQLGAALMPATVYVPRDAAALSLGAERVAEEIRSEASVRALEIRLVRNGTRGMCWLEPLVEVDGPGGRIAYGPVRSQDVSGLFDSEFLRGGAHPLRLGPVETIPYFARQER